MAEQKTTEPKQNRLTGIKKRQQIEIAGRTMFMWVAIAAVAVSFCVATGQYLFVKWDYNNKIIGKKYATAQTLVNNIANANELKKNIDALKANQELASVKTDPNDPNTKSVLDALPTSLDSSALATSLQQVILSRSGVTVESISVPPDADTTATAAQAQQHAPQEVKFNVVVSGTFDKVKSLIIDLGRTIRPMKITNLTITGSDNNMRAAIDVVTYYQPAKSVTLGKETVK